MNYREETTEWLNSHLAALRHLLSQCEGHPLMDPQYRQRIEEIESALRERAQRPATPAPPLTQEDTTQGVDQ